MSANHVRRAGLLLITALSSVLGAHCGSSTSPKSLLDPVAEPPGLIDAGNDAGDTELCEPPCDKGAAPTSGGVRDLPLATGIVLVNATTSFPAFRLCRSSSVAPTPMFSRSSSPPLPTKLMPKSNLAGVDINGAVDVERVSELANDDEVLLLKITETTALNPALAAGTCEVLACEGALPCLGAGNVVRVPMPKGALNTKGNLVILTDTSGKPAFEVLPAFSEFGQKDVLQVQLVNRSSERQVFYAKSPGVGERQLQDGLTKIEIGKLPESAFRAGDYSATLAEIHANSDPRRPIEDFYAAPGAFALLLLGTAKTTRPLKFLAIPLGPPQPPAALDGGRD